jgi:mevalonate kinase
MLFGEHAVLYGKPAIVAAIDKRLKVTISPSEDGLFTLFSDRFPKREIQSLEALSDTSPDIIDHILLSYKDRLTDPLRIDILSDFDHTLGFGSSAALIASLLVALELHCSNQSELDNQTKLRLFRKGRKIIQKIQGGGSGSDLAASLFGGCLYYQMEPFALEHLDFPLKISSYYSGFKTATKDVIQLVKKSYEQETTKINTIFDAIGSVTEEAKFAILQNDFQELQKLLKNAQQYYVDLNISHPVMDKMIVNLSKEGFDWGKISGAGLGDSLVLLLEKDTKAPCLHDHQSFELHLSKDGCRVE